MKEKEKLYNFIVNNHNLEILESMIDVFNPFNILAIENYEIRHSNVLAWLLNPNGNHGLGDYFLKKVLCQAVLINEDVLGDEINLMKIHLADFGDTIVRREEQNIDILLRSKRNKLLFIIENKIHSKESKHQLTKYLDYAKSNYSEYKRIPILLTKTGNEPENNNEFGILSHEIIHKLIQETLNLKKNYLTDEISNFIKFYLQTLEKALGMDEELKELCLKIYNEHQDAIDLIIETIGNNETSLKESFQSFKKGHDIEEYYLSDKVFWFLPVELAELLPKRDLGWRVPYPIAIWISKRDDTKIKFHLEIGPFESGEERLRFINFLEKNNYSIRNSAKRLESKYTRLVTNTLKIKDWSDKEDLTENVEKIYSKNKSEINRIIETIKKYEFKTP